MIPIANPVGDARPRVVRRNHEKPPAQGLLFFMPAPGGEEFAVVTPQHQPGR